LSVISEPQTKLVMRHMPDTRRLSGWCLCLLLVLPWINPFTAGPTPGMWPWLVSAACIVPVWFFWRKMSVELIALAWVWAGAISSLIGLVQYFGLSYAFSPWISQTHLGDAFANLRQRNQFATLTSIALVALIAWFARRPPAERVPAWGFALTWLLALGNTSSGSRTGMLEWMLILALSVLWFFSTRRNLVLFAVQAMAAYLLAVVALPWVLEIVTGIHTGGVLDRLAETSSCGSRKILWSNVLTLIGQRPWVGWGWGELDYAHFITLYPGPRFCEILDNAHNLPLHLAVELGVPAALAICGALAWITWRAKPWREKNPTRQMAWAVLAVIMLHSMLEYPLWYGPFQIAFGLCVALLYGALASSPGDAALPPARFPEKIRILVAALLAGALVYTAISYHRVSQVYLPLAERREAYRDDPLGKIRDTRFFRNQARFAELSMTGLNLENAARMHALALDVLHYSPEPRVVEKLIESAVMLGQDDDSLKYLARYRAAFPGEYAQWALLNKAGSDARRTAASRPGLKN
jgi:O-antigen ligase